MASLCVGLVLLSSQRNGVAIDLGDNQPLQPEVEAASKEAAEAMSAIRIPEGWNIGLFAAEPDVANIVAFQFDQQGRVYVCESFRQNRGVTDNRAHDEQWLLADLAAVTVQDRIDYHQRLLGEAAITYSQHDDRIRRLTDSDTDAVADQSEVIANGFNGLEEGTGAGVLVRGNTVYFTCIPKLWKLADSDGDGSFDKRTALSDGYGVRVAFRGHDLHGLIVGPDGRLYFTIGDRGYKVTTKEGRVLADPASGAVFRCELDGTGLEVFARGLRNPQELAFNDLGDLFTVDNNSDSGDQARIVHLLEGGDSGWRMYYQYLPKRGPFQGDRIWEPFHQQQPAYIVPPVANLTDGPSGLAFYPGTGFGADLKDKFFICDFRGGPANSGIRSFQLQPEGAFYKLVGDDQPIWNCLATDVEFGPDGAMYVSDWVDGWNGTGKGRLYRLHDPEHIHTAIVGEVTSLLKSDWSNRPTADLAKDLSHVDRRIRLEAQWQLAERSEHPLLLDTARDTDQSQLARLHAIWGVDQIARREDDKAPSILASLRSLLEDQDPIIRAAAARTLGQRGDKDSIPKLQELIADESPRVQYFATMALGKLGDEASFDRVVGLLAKNNNADPAIRHAGIMYLTSAAKTAQLTGLTTHKIVSVRRAAVVALRGKESGELSAFLGDSDPLVVAETARAIHDSPLAVATTALAGMIDESLAPKELKLDDGQLNPATPLTRRVLNANYRLGTQQAAERLAKYAGRITEPTAMRIEALEMLAEWKTPDPRDRVLNDFRPLTPRDPKLAAAALEGQIEVLGSASEEVREKMIVVASKLGIKKIVPMLAKRIVDADLRSDLRASALTALARLDGPFAVKLAKQVPLTPTSSLLNSSLRVIADHDPKSSIDKFIQATGSADAKVRQLAWDILGKTNHPAATESIRAGVRDLITGKLTPDVQLNVLEASQKRLTKELDAQLSAYLQSAAEKDPLAKWLPSLDGGDVGKGAELFFNRTELSCVRCHKVDRAGGEVGPNLTIIGKQKDRRYLLESICLPSAQIAKGYETAVIADDSGDTITGIVKTETDEYVELILANGSIKRVKQNEIELRRRGQSSMPADLVDKLSPRELRDLIAYLASLKADPRAEDDPE